MLDMTTDFDRWIVAQANAYARHHGLRQFSVYQGQWNAAQRDFEREVSPYLECAARGSQSY